jgi:hypothetical protein
MSSPTNGSADSEIPMAAAMFRRISSMSAGMFDGWRWSACTSFSACENAVSASLLFTCQAELFFAVRVAALLPVFDLLPRVAQQFSEGLRRIREAPAQLLACLFSLTAFAQAIRALALQPRFLGFPLLDLITACFTVLSLQIAQDCGVVIQVL